MRPAGGQTAKAAFMHTVMHMVLQCSSTRDTLPFVGCTSVALVERRENLPFA